MRQQREVMEMEMEMEMELRTPQHPTLALASNSNNWGGASPLLARNIPKEALEQRYLRLNTIRSATIEDEIFKSRPSKTIGDHEIFAFLKADGAKYEYVPSASRRHRLWRWRWRPRKKSVTLGNSSFKWLPKWDSKNRWPNGWC